MTQKTLGLIGLPLFFQLLLVSTLLSLLDRSDAEIHKEQHAKDVVSKINECISLIGDTGFTLGGYSMTKNKMVYNLYAKKVSAIPPKLEDLRTAIASDRDQAAMADQLLRDWDSMHRQLETARAAIEDVDANHYVDQKQLFAGLKSTYQKVADDLLALEEANRSIEHRAPQLQSNARFAFIATLISGLSLSALMTVFLAYSFSSDLKRRISALADDTIQLARGKPLDRTIGGSDEIAALERQFQELSNALADAKRREIDVLQNASDVICTINEAGKFTSMNPACLERWGYEQEDLLALNYVSIIADESKAEVQRVFEQATQQGENQSVKCIIVSKDGSFRQIVWSVRWATAQKTFYCVAHDITEREVLERLKQEFMALVSHDLRTPLTAIHATLQLLRNGSFGPLTEPVLTRLQRAEHSSNRVIRLINDLLDMEKLEAGKLELELSNIEVLPMLNACLDEVRELADAKNIAFETHSEVSYLYADEQRIIQVLVNLLSNAVKFSPNGGRVVVSGQKGENGFAVVEVQDNGRGIAILDQSVVFDRFKQLQRHDSQEGSGLGLPICKQIVEMHGGKIGVRSRPGEGSTFWFTIPGGD